MNDKDLFPAQASLLKVMNQRRGDMSLQCFFEKTEIVRRTWNDSWVEGGSGVSLGTLRKFCHGMEVPFDLLIAEALGREVPLVEENYNVLTTAQKRAVDSYTDADFELVEYLRECPPAKKDSLLAMIKT